MLLRSLGAQHRAAEQGKFRNIAAKKGTIVYQLDPGGDSKFFTTPSGLKRARGDAGKLNEGLQVAPHPEFPMRTRVQAYIVTEDVAAAKGIAKANKMHGDGGLPQIYITDRSKLKAIEDPIGLGH